METRGLQRFIRCFQLLPQRPMDRRQAGSSWTPRQRTHVDQMWTRVPQMGSAGPACQVSFVLCAHPEDTEHSSKEPGAIQNATAGDSNRLETLKQNRSHQTQTADSSLQMLTRPAGPHGHVHPEVARISDVRTPGHRHRVGLRRAGRAAGTRERGALGRHGGGGHGARPGGLHHGDPSPHSVKTPPPTSPHRRERPAGPPRRCAPGPASLSTRSSRPPGRSAHL